MAEKKKTGDWLQEFKTRIEVLEERSGAVDELGTRVGSLEERTKTHEEILTTIQDGSSKLLENQERMSGLLDEISQSLSTVPPGIPRVRVEEPEEKPEEEPVIAAKEAETPARPSGPERVLIKLAKSLREE